MSVETVNHAVRTAVQNVWQQEQAHFNNLYRKKPQELRVIERNELIQRAIQLPLTAQGEMKKALETARVSHVHTVWQKISESLPTVSYTYIDWNSLDPEKQAAYSREVTSEHYEKAKSGRSILIASGCLAVGSVALMCIIPKGSPLTKLFAFVAVTAAAVSGMAIIRILSTRKAGQKAVSPTVAHDTSSQYSHAILAAQRANEDALKKWCQELEQNALRVCREDAS